MAIYRGFQCGSENYEVFSKFTNVIVKNVPTEFDVYTLQASEAVKCLAEKNYSSSFGEGFTLCLKLQYILVPIHSMHISGLLESLSVIQYFVVMFL